MDSNSILSLLEEYRAVEREGREYEVLCTISIQTTGSIEEITEGESFLTSSDQEVLIISRDVEDDDGDDIDSNLFIPVKNIVTWEIYYDG